MYYLGIEEKDIIKYELLKNDTTSLNTKVKDEDDLEIGDLVPDPDSSIEEIYEKEEIITKVKEYINNSNLTERERLIIKLRFGLDNPDNKKMTLEEVGKKYNLTRERVRQIEAKAIIKLKRNKNAKNFAVYMDNPDNALKSLTIYKNHPQKDKTTSTQSKKKIISIYETLKDFSKEEIDNEIKKCSAKEKELLLAAYGPDFENPYRTEKWNTSMSSSFNNLKNKIKKKLINNIIKEEQEKKEQLKITEEQPTTFINVNAPSNSQNKITPIYSLLNKYDKEKINRIIETLNKHDKEVLSSDYGKDLENPTIGFDWSKNKTEFYLKLIPKIKTMLETTNGISSKNKVLVKTVNNN